jgi:hypothetical protein
VLSVCFAATIVVVAAVPASAAEGLGEKQPWGISGAQMALLFVGIPVAVFAIVIALVYGTSRKSEPRLREGQAWWSAPDYHAAEGSAPAVDTEGTDGAAAAPRTTDGGGTGARW